jgi:hypothetical protein
MTEHEHTFELLGECVRIQTNNRGDFVHVLFGNALIEDSFGECFTWESVEHLSGAARSSSIRRQLRDRAEFAISEYLCMSPHYRERSSLVSFRKADY